MLRFEFCYEELYLCFLGDQQHFMNFLLAHFIFSPRKELLLGLISNQIHIIGILSFQMRFPNQLVRQRFCENPLLKKDYYYGMRQSHIHRFQGSYPTLPH